jgi:hypothetical protein
MLAIAAVALTLFSALGVQAQRPNDRGPGSYGSQTQQLGYEHGYRDGADRGRQDRDRHVGRHIQDNDYLDSARYSYQPSLGSRREYMGGYRDGYMAGYDDGYNYYDRPGRYGQIYRQRQGGGRDDRGGNSFGTPFDRGYREGIASGQNDERQNTRSDYRRSDAYRRGDQTFQDGFERGYQDGYGRSRISQDGGGYFPNHGNTGPADTRDGVGPQTRTITVPSTQQWTPTSIRVNQGDRIQLQATGEIRLRPASFNDKAGVAGAFSHRLAPNSPIPSAFAGALIGRIDSGQPFGIGDQASIVAPGSGLLYLGVNDDVLTDNSGQFQVKVSW